MSGLKVSGGSTALEEIKKYFSGNKKIRRRSRAVGFYRPIGIYPFNDCVVSLYTTVSAVAYANVEKLLLNPYVLNWVDYEETMIQPGFKPAKLILTAKYEKISKPSQITGLYYNTRNTTSFTLPFGKPKERIIDFSIYVSEVIMNNIDRKKFKVRILPEEHPKC